MLVEGTQWTKPGQLYRFRNLRGYGTPLQAARVHRGVPKPVTCPAPQRGAEPDNAKIEIKLWVWVSGDDINQLIYFLVLCP
jgi:hypothetical protein